ncbi:MAG TPA: RagB/SusD family nutrient uptake outer membrane protein [Balneolaceae bacterium]|nr:RagB/SusD family nutrient uptake outer membrane protein [Balneolaceae bacterium]
MSFQNYLSGQEQGTDEMVIPRRPNGWYDGGRYYRMQRHTWTPVDFTPASGWDMSFNGINAANRVLGQIKSGKIPIKSGKTQLIAELKAARAFYYSILLDNYGNVPIVTKFNIKSPPKQSTAKQVYNFVVKQLKEAIPNLSTKVNSTYYGRFNKWSAETCLAHVYMMAKVHTGTAEWNKVIKVTSDIINSGKYHLAANYKTNFQRNTQLHSPEIIFAVPYDQVNGPGNQYHESSIPPQMKSEFHMKAQPWGGSAVEPQFAGTYHQDDKRLSDTWFRGKQKGPKGNVLINLRRNIPQLTKTKFRDGYRVKKYQIYDGININSDVDFPYYRYAQVLMMKAEALLRTGDATDAAKLVTKVRMRDFSNPDSAKVTGADLKKSSSEKWGWWQPNGTVKSPNPSGTKIKYGGMLDQLGWEFADEGKRRDEMIRFGAYTTKTWFNHKPLGHYTKYFPIPQSALKTNSNLKQNPGY